MDLSILHYDKAARWHVLKLKQGRWAGQAFHVEMNFCRCTTCGCADVDWTCKPVDAAALEYTISLDTRERCVSTLPPGVVSVDEQALAEAIVAELQDPDWHTLFGEIVSGKRDAIDAMDPMAELAEFPPEAMSGESDYVCFAEIFPYGNFDAIEVGQQHWLVDDIYCINPECKCSETLLVFKSAKQPEGPIPAVYYDYKTGQMGEIVETPAQGQPTLEALLGRMHDSGVALNLELENRHLKLRVCYLQALLRQKGIPVEAPEKIGRNDPCPCGSGKKYKKCCGIPDR